MFSLSLKACVLSACLLLGFHYFRVFSLLLKTCALSTHLVLVFITSGWFHCHRLKASALSRLNVCQIFDALFQTLGFLLFIGSIDKSLPLSLSLSFFEPSYLLVLPSFLW